MSILIGVLFQLIVWLVLFSILSSFMLFLMKRNVKWTNVVLSAFVLFVLLMSAPEIIQFALKGGGYLDELKESIRTFSQIAAVSNGGKELTPEETKNLNEIIGWVIKLYPGAFLAGSFFMVTLAYSVTRLIAISRFKISDPGPNFELWYLNEGVIWSLIVAIAALLVENIIKIEMVQIVAFNVIIFLAVMYLMIGLAIITFLIKNSKLPRFYKTFLALGVVIVMSIPNPAVMASTTFIIVLTGVFDTWFNFRKIDKGGSIWR